MLNLEKYELVPFAYFQTKKNENYIVKKLIRPEEKDELLPLCLSDYINEFIQGADLIPKSLLLCNIVESVPEGHLYVVNPWISPQAKGVWKKAYYKNERVEVENIFKTTLSRGLYPFYIKFFNTFLPLDNQLYYNLKNLGPFSRKHWNFISEVYKQYKNDDLFEVGINYRNKLCTGNNVREQQRAQIKVVFPNAKNLMSAVIHDPDSRIFVDSTLYYYGTNDVDEAYYICGMLNIPTLFKNVKTIADTRHHHKRPLYFNIPRYVANKE